MKYWSGDDVLEKDVLKGEIVLDPDNPRPAYKGTKLDMDGADDVIYEMEIVPGSERVEGIIDPSTFDTTIGTVVDVLYRVWDDDIQDWKEIKMPALLSAWGYDDMPENKVQKQMTNFDRAMRGI